MPNNLTRPSLILEEIVFIDGLTRAGKFLLAKIVSNMEAVEYFQSQILIEHLPIFNYLKLMDNSDAISYFKLNINNYIYERLIGRNINTRIESSGINNATDYDLYLKRATELDGAIAVQKGLSENRLPSFLVHEVLPHIEFIQTAVPKFKMINIQRHPLDIVFSWFQRGWGDRWGNDNLAFTPTLDINGIATPWFAVGWPEEWAYLRPLERVIKSILHLYELEDVAYNNFNNKQKILRISYEALFSNPMDICKKISFFLGRHPYENMAQVLEREACPNKSLSFERQSRIAELKKLAQPKYYEMAVEASNRYDSKWLLPPMQY